MFSHETSRYFHIASSINLPVLLCLEIAVRGAEANGLKLCFNGVLQMHIYDSTGTLYCDL